MNESGDIIRLITVTVLVCSLLAGTAYAGRRYPDDPAGTPIFQERLKPELNENVTRVQQQYARDTEQLSTVDDLVLRLASYEIVTNETTGKKMEEAGLAERDLRRTGSNAVPALIAALSFPNVRIRRLAVAVLLNIAVDTGRETEMLPLFSRSTTDVNPEVRKNAVGAIGMICRSLAGKKQYQDCTACIDILVDALKDEDESVRYRAAIFLYRFDRFEMVPRELQDKLAIEDLPRRSWRFPLPREEPDGGGVIR